MVFVACGLNHQTAPLVLRERVAILPFMQDKALQDLLALPKVNEAAILSTCNRTEVYCDMQEPENLLPILFEKEEYSTSGLLTKHSYLYQGKEGLKHLLRVSSGLDSMLLGEPQIFGQMKRAYHQARNVGAVKKNFNVIFNYVFSASKRIRNQSGIGLNPISIASAALQLLKREFKELSPLKVLLIGSGETASLVAKYLSRAGVTQFQVASRTRDHAVHLAKSLDAKAFTIGELLPCLGDADIVISATSCPIPFISKSLVEHALNLRHHHPMVFLDLALPRDIEANVAGLPQVTLYNLDDIQNLSDEGLEKRKLAAKFAEDLIEDEIENYQRWRRSLKAKKTLCHYRSHMKDLAQKELIRAQAKLRSGLKNEEILDEFCQRLLNKLLHQPTLGLKKAAEEGRGELLELSHYLYSLSDAPL